MMPWRSLRMPLEVSGIVTRSVIRIRDHSSLIWQVLMRSGKGLCSVYPTQRKRTATTGLVYLQAV